jgi:sigma-B regulation protein RsbU (phosphoserine phosphatase)
MLMAKILAIDEKNEILQRIKFVLERENNKVITAFGSEEGLDIFNKYCNTIDIVIIDTKLLINSEMELLRKVKKILPHLSVMVLAEHDDMENAILAIKEGAFGYIKKPFIAEELLIAVDNALNNKNLLLENVRMTRELLEQKEYLHGLHDSAVKILLNMLPESLPHIQGFNFDVKYKSCDAVGGDMYDVSDIGDYVCFYVFDVSSHGILAAVISTIIKSFLKNIEYNYKQGINKRRFPEIVLDLNLQLLSNTEQNVFASLFLGFIDKKTKVLYTVSAGHITQYIVKADRFVPLESTGPILGVFEDSTYTCNVNPLEPGDKIWLFTDGVIEASSNNEIFGIDNLLKLLNNNKNDSLSSVTDKIMKSVRDFSDNSFLDDITILGIEVMK